MAKTFHLTIARVGETLFDANAVSARLPGAEGEFTVLAEHEAFVTPLQAGVAEILAADGSRQSITIPEGGIAEVSRNQATVLL